jgi:hypothetical protein
VSALLSRWSLLLIISLWAALLLAALLVPLLGGAADPGDALTRNTVRLALLYYAAALTLLLRRRPADWAADTPAVRLARCCWTLAWAAFLVHLGMALHHVDGWSHAAAVERTRQRTGFGEGVYVSHLFTLVWTADVVFWWLAPRRYAARSPRIDLALHAFMLFMTFNAMVVFESGFIRWAGLALFIWLAGVALTRPKAVPPRSAAL